MRAVRKGWIENGVGYIPLTQGQVALVDHGDVVWLTRWNWYACLVKHTGGFYAVRTEIVDGKKNMIFMHRQILGLVDRETLGDHQNHDSLDNRRRNLRAATHQQNQANRKIHKRNSTGYKGIYLDRRRNKYRSQIEFNGCKKWLGYFDTAEEAHQAYVSAAEQLHGEFACAG